MSDRRFDAKAEDMQDGEETVKASIDARHSAFVNPSYRYSALITVATPLVPPADGITASADTTITATLAEDTAAQTFHLLAGVYYPYAIKDVATSTAGILTALYHRKPAPGAVY